MPGSGWVEAGSLGIGNSIITRAGPLMTVANVAWKRDTTAELATGGGIGSATVYNLTVADDHTFFVGTTGGGTWVHNGFPCGGKNFPDTVKEMDSIMGKAGKYDGGPSEQHIWEFSEEDGSLSRFRYENHPEGYRGFVARHTEPHFHYDTNGPDFTHSGTFLPGEPIP